MQKQGKLSFENWDCEYSEEGQGPLVLGLHGHLSDKSVWQACSQWFAQKDYRFVAYTQRYYGTSAWPDNGANFNRETHVNDLLNVIAALDAGPVHLLTCRSANI